MKCLLTGHLRNGLTLQLPAYKSLLQVIFLVFFFVSFKGLLINLSLINTLINYWEINNRISLQNDQIKSVIRFPLVVETRLSVAKRRRGSRDKTVCWLVNPNVNTRSDGSLWHLIQTVRVIRPTHVFGEILSLPGTTNRWNVCPHMMNHSNFWSLHVLRSVIIKSNFLYIALLSNTSNQL